MTFESIGGVKARSAEVTEIVKPVQKNKDTVRSTNVKEIATDTIDSGRKISDITVQPLFNSEQEGLTEESENKESQATEKQIKNAVSQANQKIKHSEGTKLEFSYHEKTKRVSIQVIDKDTKELIREIPPEKSLDMLQKMWELAGILVDERR